jgi:WD40 repeat protein
MPSCPQHQRQLYQQRHSALSLPGQSYIYSLARGSGETLAAISSDSSLRLFDRHTLQLLPNGVLENTHLGGGVTCLAEAGDGGNLLATGGRDGRAKVWDVRGGRKTVVEFATGELG